MNPNGEKLIVRKMKEKMSRIKAALLTAGLIMALSSTTAFAANKEFKFSLSNNSSAESSVGSPAVKSNDGDTYAYVTPDSSKSNLAIKGAAVNVRVRDNAKNYATSYVTCNSYQKYKLQYLSGKAVGGASYRLYGNVEYTNSYPVRMGGMWCP